MKMLTEKPEVIIYSSNAGHSKRYAEIIGEATGLPVRPVTEPVNAGTKVLYIGWLMAGKINGYAKAAKKYKICAVCGVGMGDSESQTEDIKKANPIPDDVPLFYLQGGFDMNLVRGIYKFMMKTVAKGAIKKYEGKENLTDEEKSALEMITTGVDCVSIENARCVIEAVTAMN